ncbi:MAG: putative periplasmic membrane protein [Ktedonobacterales bacterium]|jgi:uncharacterized protein YdeI (YjbR/CyaY-like superfamily)|nr:MAG: putative periplasmic membrane protein [Ktedonobacterales bacterium]
MTNTTDHPTIAFATQQELEAWLAQHHADTSGLWLKIAKNSADIPTVSYAEAVESALCYGWIDSQKATFDSQYFLQKFTPRRPKSVWSRVNREKATALIAAGRMQPAGLRQIELAQADGRWEAAYDSQSTIAIPPDLQAALDAHPDAKAFFATLDSANRYAILYRLQTAKKPETRAARIEKFIGMLAQREKIHP